MNYKLALAACILSLTGCSSLVGQHQKFPDVDPALTTPCAKLDLVPAGTTKLSELEKVVSGNYTKYHQCANVVDGWNKWYSEQKKNSDNLGK
jgi:hypothetical protein